MEFPMSRPVTPHDFIQPVTASRDRNIGEKRSSGASEKRKPVGTGLDESFQYGRETLGSCCRESDPLERSFSLQDTCAFACHVRIENHSAGSLRAQAGEAVEFRPELLDRPLAEKLVACPALKVRMSLKGKEDNMSSLSYNTFLELYMCSS